MYTTVMADLKIEFRLIHFELRKSFCVSRHSERLKVKFNAFGVLTLHLPMGNGDSVAATMVDGEYVFGRVAKDGTFEESESRRRLPASGKRLARG